MKTILTSILFIVAVISTSNAQWTQCNGPLGGNITSFTSNGTSIYAGTDGRGTYRSNDNGATWEPIKKGNNTGNDSVRALATIGTTVFIGTSGRTYRSKDNGTTWNDTKLSNVQTLSVVGSMIIAEANDYVMSSTDEGETWKELQMPIKFKYINSFAIVNNILYAGAIGSNGDGVIRSTDYGATWFAANVGLTFPAVTVLAVSGSTLYAGTAGNAVYQTSDLGKSWVRTSKGLTSKYINALVVSGTTLFAGTDGGIFRSLDNGNNWTVANNGLTNLDVRSIHTVGTTIYAGTYGGGVFRSTDNGDTWESVGIPIQDVTGLTMMGNSLYASSIGSVYRSTDNGTSWVATGLTNKKVLSIGSIGTTLIAGLETDGTERALTISKDSGVTWSKIENSNYYIPALLTSGTTVFAGAINGVVYRSLDSGNTWTVSLHSDSKSYRALVANGSTVFAGNYVGGGIYRSTDNGDTWVKRDTGIIGSKSISSLGIMGGFVFAGTRTGGIFRSGDNGDTWTHSGLETKNVNSIAVSGTTIYAGTTEAQNIYSSTDNGDTWTLIDMNRVGYPHFLFVSGNTLFAARNYASVWKITLPPLDVKSEPSLAGSLLRSYPNPASSSITIDRTSLPFTTSAPVSYSLSSVTGEKVMEFERSEPIFSIPLDGYAKGVYCLTAAQGTRRTAVIVTVVE